MKKISLSLIFIIFFQNPLFAQENQININEAVDLSENSKYYKNLKKTVDDLRLIDIYPDHTFRGGKFTNRKDITLSALKLIKFIESKKKISLKKTNSIVDFYSDIEKDQELNKVFFDLSENYSFDLFEIHDKKFNSQKDIIMSEFNYIVNKILYMYKESDKNPYSAKIEKFDYNSSENLIKIGIIKNKKDFKPNAKITRYDLSEYLIRIVNYLNF